jgi:hypothetical protein
MDPVGFNAAMSALRRSALSALPDAPVRPERLTRRPVMDHAVRRALARGLHVLADRVEPRPVRPTPAPVAEC